MFRPVGEPGTQAKVGEYMTLLEKGKDACDIAS